jgi:hypothetical protein
MANPAEARRGAPEGARARGLLAALLLGALATDARAVDTMPIDQVRPGMKGYAVTVFSGDKTDRFEIEVIDVVRDYLPRQDAILFRSADPRMIHSGIVGGMSGSPIYIDGKLVGALAYGYRFNKDPIGGITPIANMLAVDALPYRPEVLPHTPRIGGQARPGAAAWADAILGLGVTPLPPRRRPEELDPVGSLTPLGAPMSVSGFGPGATRLLGEELGLVPVRGGSGRAGAAPDAAAAAAPKRWQGGDSVSVVLVRGDNAAAPNGTVTWVGGRSGERLLAFGHPMFGGGPTSVPIADARVHVIIPSVDRSVKVSSPLTVRGALIQDRQAAIALRTDIQAEMIPVTTHLVAPEPELGARTYRSEVAQGVDLTPALVASLLTDAAEEGAPDAAAVMAEITHIINLETSKGPRSVTIRDEYFFDRGVELRDVGRARGLLVLRILLDNQFEVARVRGVEQTIKLAYGDAIEEIEEVRVAQSEVHAGDLLRLEVWLRGRRGERRRELIDVRIPDDAGDQEVQLQVTGGEQARPYRPLPRSLDDVIDTLEAAYPARSLVVSVYREGEGLSTQHGLLDSLPGSVLESLSIDGSTRGPVRYKQAARRVLPTAALIAGDHNLRISVLPARATP